MPVWTPPIHRGIVMPVWIKGHCPPQTHTHIGMFMPACVDTPHTQGFSCLGCCWMPARVDQGARPCPTDTQTVTHACLYIHPSTTSPPPDPHRVWFFGPDTQPRPNHPPPQKERCDPYKDATLPEAPPELVNELSRRYIMLYELITGEAFLRFAAACLPACLSACLHAAAVLFFFLPKKKMGIMLHELIKCLPLCSLLTYLQHQASTSSSRPRAPAPTTPSASSWGPSTKPRSEVNACVNEVVEGRKTKSIYLFIYLFIYPCLVFSCVGLLFGGE